MTQCTHVYRSGQLHPSIKVGGGVFMGQCSNECYPDLVVCYEHANKEALSMLVQSYRNKCVRQEAEIHQLKQRLHELEQMRNAKKGKGKVKP